MVELIAPTTQMDRTALLRAVILDIKRTYSFDDIMVMHFAPDKDHPYVRISFKQEGLTVREEYNFMLNIDEYDRSFFRQLYNEKKAIYYRSTREPSAGEIRYKPYNKNAKSEIYYPLVGKDDEVIGCLYFSSGNEQELNTGAFLEDYRLYVINKIISELYIDGNDPFRIIYYLKLFDDFLVKNNPNVLRHHYNVAFMTAKIAEELNMTPEDRLSLYYASLLHDIGEIYINGNILNKDDKLTDKEFQIVQNHVVYGANLVKRIISDEHQSTVISKIIMQHHERYDGKGYPKGLKGNKISLLSRIISAADALDSMLAGRSYKASMTVDEAIKELKANKGVQFDSKIVDVIIKILYERSATKLNLKSIPIITAVLRVISGDENHLIQGTLISKNNLYEFHPNYSSDSEMVDWTKPAQLNLFYVANRDIFEYQAVFKELKDGIIFLLSLESTYTMLTYSLFWELDGKLYLDKDRSIHIKTTRISGDTLSFMISREDAEELKVNDNYKIGISFDGERQELIAGKVTQCFETGDDYIFLFSFESLGESSKERIIRNLVRKQADLRLSYLFDSN